VPGAIVRILDDEGAEMPAGVAGEIVVEGPMVVPGYWNRPEETATALPGGRLLTGDIGFIHGRDGWVYVVDRKKDMINASGFKVCRARSRTCSTPTRRCVKPPSSACGPYRGETVKAYVSVQPGAVADPQDLIAYCKEMLAAYKYPRDLEVLEELPKTVSGKVLRRELRARHQRGY
jgi:long-chain acyl-CoA synthetase